MSLSSWVNVLCQYNHYDLKIYIPNQAKGSSFRWKIYLGGELLKTQWLPEHNGLILLTQTVVCHGYALVYYAFVYIHTMHSPTTQLVTFQLRLLCNLSTFTLHFPIARKRTAICFGFFK